MKKRTWIFVMMVFLLVSQVSANYVDDFLGIKYDSVNSNNENVNSTCLVGDVLLIEKEFINDDPTFQDIISVFDDGDDVVYFSNGGFMDTYYYSINKQGNQILSIKRGICSSNFKEYIVKTNINDFISKMQDPNANSFHESFLFIRNIEGIDLIKKIKIIKIIIENSINLGGTK